LVEKNYDKYKYCFRIHGEAKQLVGEIINCFAELRERYNLNKILVMEQDVSHARGAGNVLSNNTILNSTISGIRMVDSDGQIIKGNVITTEELKRAVSEFSRFSPDILITHSCPAGIGVGMQGLDVHHWGVVNHILMAGFNPGPSADCGETQHTLLWNQMLQQPKLWVYGHFHEQKITEVEDTTFVSLPCLDYYREYVIWDSQKKGLLHES